MKRKNFPGRRARRREEAKWRQALSLARSRFERVCLINQRPGSSAREMARLAAE
jgi:hypothetical protein